MRIFYLLTLLLSLALVACEQEGTQEPIIVTPTPAPADADFVDYRHETGVFSLRVPPGWTPGDLPIENGVRVQFSTIENNEPVVRLTAYVVNTGQPMTLETFSNTVAAYQPPADVAAFEWQPQGDYLPQTDGSVLQSGIRYYPILGPRQLNIFMQGDDTYFTALELDVTGASEELLETLAAVINTYRINTDVSLEVGEVTSLTAASGVVVFDSYTTWSDSDGGFNITGRVVNQDDQALEAIRLTGYLFDARDNQLTFKEGILTTDMLQPGEGAPFRLRFDGGRPSTVVRYELHAAARDASFTRQDFYGRENFEVQQNPAVYNDNGNLVISGQLVNIGPRVARDVKVIVSVLDEKNNVVATETVFANNERLLPGEADSYEVVVYDLGGAAIRYELNVVGTSE